MLSYEWQLEMENMLAAFNRQATHSLSVIHLSFNRSGLSFTPEFKELFVQASTNRIIETYDRFQEQLSSSLNSVANATGRSPRNGTNGVECVADDRENVNSIRDESDGTTDASNFVIQIDDLDYDGVMIEVLETEPTDDTTAVENGSTSIETRSEVASDTISTESTSDTNDSNEGSVEIDDSHETYTKSIAHQSNTNENSIVDPEASTDVNFDVEMDDSYDSIELIEIQIDSTDADDSKLTAVKVVSNHLDETSTVELTQGQNKTTDRKSLNQKEILKIEETNEDRADVSNRRKRSSLKQLPSRNPNKCTVCGYVTHHSGHFKQHMRTHTGEKPYGCDWCERKFARKAILLKHAATHIAVFPFHCRACFQGFPSKAEAVAHEKHCRRRRYECHLCKKFLTCVKTDLIRHMRKHSGVKPFRCQICMRRFSWKRNLSRHLNNIHSQG